MKNQVFTDILEARITNMRRVLAAKADEYAFGGDRLHNFKAAARIQEIAPEEALLGMLAKHLVSVLDMVAAAAHEIYPDTSMIDEKIGDCINYLVLLEALLREHVEAA
jgi:hypothetical protein